MKPTRTHLAIVAAALSTIAIAAPISAAGAATAAPAVASATTVTGARWITTAPSTFINTNDQVSPGNTSSGSQFAS